MSDDLTRLKLVHNEEKKWFEAVLQDSRGRVEYMVVQDRIIYTHTEVDAALGGKGVASRLVKFALEYARSEGKRIMPLCPFVAGYMKRNPEYNDLLLPGFNLR